MISPLVELALDYYRNPLAYGHLADASFPLPRGFGQQFSALCTALSPRRIEATAGALDSTPQELKDAVRFFARHVLLDTSASHYRALGVSPRAPNALIREHYLHLMQFFHPDRLPDPTEADVACSQRLNSAYQVLSNPDLRARYDREHRGRKQRGRCSDPCVFFGRHYVPLESTDQSPRSRLSVAPGIWLIGLGVLGLGFVGTAWVLWPSEPLRSLRASAPLETATERPRPRYLHRVDSAGTTTGRSALLHTATEPASGSAGIAHARLMRPVAEHSAAGIGSRIANELQIAARRGDSVRLAELFAESLPDALSHATDPARSAQPASTASDDQIWLTLTNMVWRDSTDDRIIGHGHVVLNRDAAPDGAAREFSGTIRLELVPGDADYRIHRLHMQKD